MQETFGILPTAAMDLALQLLDFFPVLLLTYGKQGIPVNIPEVIMTPDCFEKLLTYDSSVQAQQKSSCTVYDRLSMTEYQCMTEFIKQHGLSAHSRRGEETGTVGVSLGNIRDHLIQNIPGLSKHTVAQLREPPRRGTIAGK